MDKPRPLFIGESLGKLVRTAEKAKIPVMCVVGNKEAETDTLAVRTYGGGQQSDMQSDEVLSRLMRAVSAHGKF
jgi:threonyl-tRNA synthetase